MFNIGPQELIILVPVFAVFFLPTIVALERRSSRVATVLLINVILGATGVGWAIALVIALNSPPRPHHPRALGEIPPPPTV
jgi:hypothetical protein